MSVNDVEEEAIFRAVMGVWGDYASLARPERWWLEITTGFDPNTVRATILQIAKEHNLLISLGEIESWPAGEGQHG